MACYPFYSLTGIVSDDPVITDSLFFIQLEFFYLFFFTHLFHLGLKRLGQPIITSAILAGIVTGDTGLRRARIVSGALKHANTDILSKFSERMGALYVLLIGLNLDLTYFWRNRFRSLVVGYSSIVVAVIIFLIAHFILKCQLSRFSIVVVLFLAHTSSPIAIRIITQLKLVGTDIGRLAILSSLVNDLTCVIIFSLIFQLPWTNSGAAGLWTICGVVFFAVVTLVALRPFVRWLNRRNQRRRYIRNYELTFVLLYLLWLVILVDYVGFNGILLCFLIGVLLPRDGAMIRTLRDKFTYVVHNVVLPLYFGWTSSRINLTVLGNSKNFAEIIGPLLMSVLLSVLAKVGGTIMATTYLKIPFLDGLALGFILNVRGSVDILSVAMLQSETMKAIMGKHVLTIILITVALNSLGAGVVGTILARWKDRVFKNNVAEGLKQVELEGELRVLACVYHPIEVPCMLALASVSKGLPSNPICILVEHLIGLPKNYNKHTTFYHQRHDKDERDDDDSLGQVFKHVPQINACVDAFTKETGIHVRQTTITSFFDNMHSIVCQDIYDYHKTLVLIPSHKEQRYDYKMACRKEDRRRLNNKILKESPCTVGILLDRPLTGGLLPAFGKRISDDVEADYSVPFSNTAAASDIHRVISIFCGGPDDREALEYTSRIAVHPQTDVTVVRFSPSPSRDTQHPEDRIVRTSSNVTSEIAMIIHKDEEERLLDDEFLEKFQQRFVATGHLQYSEKFVSNGGEIETELRSMVGMYSLFIVGKGGRQPMAMMAGLSDWQECIEIGPIGDMLSSDSFMETGSVLIIQRPNDRSKGRSLIDTMFHHF